MKKINRYFVRVVLNPIGGLADDDHAFEHYQDFNSNDEAVVRTLIREEIRPYLESLDRRSHDRISDAFRFYLSRGGMDFERVFYSMLPPFEAPRNPRDFFVWIWEECFGGDYDFDEESEFEIVDDYDEPTWFIKRQPLSS